MDISSSADVLLVVEHGTNWSRWMDDLAEAGATFNAILQSPNESLKAFTRRVSSRVTMLSSQRRLASTILFITGAPADEVANDDRALALRAVIAKLARHGGRVLLGLDGAAGETDAATSRLQEVGADLIDGDFEGVEVITIASFRAAASEAVDHVASGARETNLPAQ